MRMLDWEESETEGGENTRAMGGDDTFGMLASLPSSSRQDAGMPSRFLWAHGRLNFPEGPVTEFIQWTAKDATLPGHPENIPFSFLFLFWFAT